MANQFTDTFCTITSSAQSPYETVFNTVTYSSAFARFTPPAGCAGGGAFLTDSSALRKNIPTISHPIPFISFGKADILPSSTNNRLLTFWDNGTEQCGLWYTPSGALQIQRGNSVVLGTSATAIIIANQVKPVSGIELEMTIATSGAIAKVWLNGNQVLNLSGLNTQSTGNASCNQVQIGDSGFGHSTGLYTDYLRVWDSSGSTQNAPIGIDRQCVTKLPSGAGANTSWTPNGLGSNYQCVSVIPPNASDYVSANGTNVIDDYAMPVAGLTTAPSQVVVMSYYFKDDSATRTYTNGVLSSGVAAVGSTSTANSSATWVQNCISLDPNTGLVWTAAGADAAHFLHEELT